MDRLLIATQRECLTTLSHDQKMALMAVPLQSAITQGIMGSYPKVEPMRKGLIMSELITVSSQDLWLGEAKDFITAQKPISWGKNEQAYVNYQTIVNGMPNAELTDADCKHLMAILLVGENTSACAQLLRKKKLLPELEKKSGEGLANKYLTM